MFLTQYYAMNTHSLLN